MAVGIYANEKYEIPWATRYYVKFRLYKMVSLKRKANCLVDSVCNRKKKPENNAYRQAGSPALFTDELEKQKEHYLDNQWAYIPNIIESEFYQFIINNWPSIKYFNPPSSYYKCYNHGFYWRDKTNSAYESPTNYSKHAPDFLEKYPWYTIFMQYLESDELQQRISDFVGQKMVFANAVLTEASAGSCVATHMDSVKTDCKTTDRIQFVLFLNGGEVPNTGELTLTKDNRWKEVIFRPPSVKNAALIFNKSGDFYHGFKPIKKGAFRWALGACFKRAEENAD